MIDQWSIPEPPIDPPDYVPPEEGWEPDPVDLFDEDTWPDVEADF